MPDIVAFLIENGVKLGLAVILGGVIGLEREASDKPAGLRTNILICVGSTLMMILSIQVARDFAVTVADPGRIAQGVITGIGFLGAGTILHSRGGVTGLTTAATTWAVAGIGLALGSGYFLLAVTTTGLIILVLWVLGWISRDWPANRHAHAKLRVVVGDPPAQLETVRQLIEAEGAIVRDWNYRRLSDGHSVIIECDAAESDVAALLAKISAGPGVRSARRI